jgi:hypothetical protein
MRFDGRALNLCRGAAIPQYAALDVSNEETAIHIIDETGAVVCRGKRASAPDVLTTTLRRYAPDLVRVGLKTGPLTPWLYHTCKALGIPIGCLPGPPRGQKRLDDGGDGRTSLDEFGHAVLEGTSRSLAGHQAERLERAADLVGQADRYAHELSARTDEVADGMGGVTLDPRLAVPTHAHELRQCRGLACVGLIPLQSRGGSCMPRVQTQIGVMDRSEGPPDFDPAER